MRCGMWHAHAQYEALLTGLPHCPQAHLLPRELTWALYAIILAFCLQIHVQAQAEPLQLIGQQLIAWAGPLQLHPEHIHLALHGLSSGKCQSNQRSVILCFNAASDHETYSQGRVRVKWGRVLTLRLSSVRPVRSPFQLRDSANSGVTSG